ncbi:MAG: PIN domain-containing protein [Chloroflexota bacterium]|nr:PIN domain-containing protein [Chloroflexota bacterium]
MARLIDASVFIELERSGRPLGVIAAGALTESHAIASITATELLFGVERANTPEHRLRRSEFIETILNTIPVVSLDVAIARVQARLWATLEGSGAGIGPYDLIAAASALVSGLDVLAFNVREFERVPGLGVIKPEW